MSSKKFAMLLTHGGAIFVRQKSTSHAIFEREKDENVYRAPVVMGKRELSPKYMKIVLRHWVLLIARSISFFRDCKESV